MGYDYTERRKIIRSAASIKINMTKISKYAASGMLIAMFGLAFFSSWNDAAIFDETAHIAAGYSYLTQLDARLNPEHPPLVKDIAAFPLLFLNLNFPTNTDAWQKQVNGQWDQGGAFLFEFGNNPDTILRAARFPVMLIGVLLGALLFGWVRSLYGNKTALLTLFLYAFSPTVIAHSRFVTTDIAAALAFFAGIAAFMRFLARPMLRRLFIAGIVFGIAELLKFSLFLLVPIFIMLAFVWLVSQDEYYDFMVARKERFVLFLKDAAVLYFKIGLIFAIGIVIIWGVYAWHIWDYPVERQLSDTATLVGTFKPQFFVKLDTWLIEHRLTRPIGQYLFGVMMVTQRSAGGNSAYFLGEVSSKGWWYYFPTVYLLKESLGFHILSLVALWLSVWRVRCASEKSSRAVRGWINDNFPIFASIFFVVFYWILSVINPLNIGVRHVLPMFPFIYFLVARQLALWTRMPVARDFKKPRDIFISIYHILIAPLPRLFLLALILAWIAAGTVAAFPYYLSYYNELAGGTQNGYWYATDSNYDWGQDLKRLRDIVQNPPAGPDGTVGASEPNEKVYLDYFGGSTAHNGAQRYWLGDQFIPWYSSFGPPPSGSVFAISANSLMGNRARPVKGFPQLKPEDTYPWLRGLEPFTRAGTSIFLYRIP